MGRQPSCGAREKIREAASHLFSEKGYDQTSVRDISRIAGVATGGLYPYFGSKEQLYVEVLREEMKQYNERLNQFRDARPQVAIQRYIETYLEYLNSRKEIMTRQFKDYDLGFVRPVTKLFFLHQKEFLESTIRKGVEQKVFVATDCVEAAEFVLCLLKGFLFYTAAGVLEIHSSGEPIYRIVLGFLRSAETRAETGKRSKP
jgi:AcrR family transcriptional regulator